MVDNETIVTEKSGNEHHFVYDYSFWSFDKHGGSFASKCDFLKKKNVHHLATMCTMTAH